MIPRKYILMRGGFMDGRIEEVWYIGLGIKFSITNSNGGFDEAWYIRSIPPLICPDTGMEIYLYEPS